ncbi:MAG: PAS domain-containing protein [Desulfobacterales bacterium]|nr:MAG: PAS domain-containing protein [Desulfobacterales bacterium]
MEEPLLVAADDAQSRHGLARALSQLGYAVMTAANREACRQMFTQHQPPIVLADAVTADEGFRELLKEIKRRKPDTELIVVVEAADRESSLKQLKHEAAAFLIRPVSADDLEVSLRGVKERIALRRQTQRQGQEIEKTVAARVAQRIETERFLTVKQIVDKLSTFIGQIARDVEGGVKYFNEMPYFVAIHNRQARVVAANRAYRTILGNPVGANSWKIYCGDSGKPGGCPVGKTLRSENALETKEWVKYRSGARVPVIVHTAPIFNNDGEVELVLEVSAGTRDVNQLKEALRNSQQRYRQLFNAVPCYLAVLDRELRLTAINRFFQEEFGDQTGALFFEVFQVNDEASGLSPIKRTFRDGQSHQGEMRLMRADGKPHNVLVWTSPIATAAGKLTQILLIFLDITQIRDLQSNLSSLGLAIGSISHSIKGVLTGLDAGVYLLEQGRAKGDEPQMVTGLDTIKRMVEQIRKMILDILFYTKERELSLERVDVQSLGDDVAEAIHPKLRDLGIEFVCDFQTPLGALEVDPGRLRPALINVLENAIDACRDDDTAKAHKIIFRITAHADAILMEVEDNGIGMNASQLKDLFTIFYSTKGTRGTGLGLFITDKIIGQHGGSITVSSEPGQGSHFCIELPRRGPELHCTSRAVRNSEATRAVESEF